MGSDNPIVHQAVSSSFMQTAGHDGDQTAEVALANGKRYRIQGITPEAFKDLVSAESVGRHFNAVIKKNYTIEPVE